MGDIGTPTTAQFKGCQVPLDKINPPTVGQGGYAGFNPRSEVLPAGWKYDHPDAKPLTSSILVEHDVAITMRDGAKLYADIYRPPNTDDKVPALIMWSPFGKKFNGILSLGLMTPWNLGIKSGTLSGLEKFEALDPADWVPRGYAIVNVDTRGTGDSEGHMVILGTQEADDGYDTIEAVAKLPWCTGSIGLAGNSHLAIAQWFIASQRPPSLKAIAPFEGCGDLFREQFARGGIYAGDLFDKLIVKYMLQGRNGVESFRQMFKEHPLANEWWNDKRPNMKNINIPTYITGTWTNTMHGMGAIRAWLEVDSKDKWLRWHPWQEWADLWGNPQARDELFSFFDHYLRGVENDWLSTPRVRMAVLRFGNKEPQSYENIVEDDFPLSRTKYKKLFLADGERLSFEPPTGASKQSATYSSADGGGLSFTHRFDKDTTLVGMPKAVLWMSCDDHDDMDVYVLIEKLDKDGKPMKNLNIPWKNVPIRRPGSDQKHPIILEDTPTPEQPAAHPTKSKGKTVKKSARDYRGRFIKSDASPEPKAERKKIFKTKSSPKPEKPARPEKTDCIICATTKSTKRSFKASGVEGICGHFASVCDLCVQKQIKTKMSARQLTEAHLPCMFPECGAVLDHTTLKSVLSRALFETWDTAVTKHLLAADASYVACLNPKCGIYFSAEACGSKHKASSSKTKSKQKEKKVDVDKAACPYCEHELCLSCIRPWHSGSCDSAKRREDRQSEKAIKKLGAKPCPKCGVNIEKQGGCDHMNCQRCRHNFCWECLGTYNGNANNHAETCSHRRPMIAHDIGNFIDDNLTVAQVNALIERTRQDREVGRAPQPNIQLAPGVRLINGVADGPAPPPAGAAVGRPTPRPEPRAPPAMNAAPRRRTAGIGGRRHRIVLREEDEASNGSMEEEQD
ncbi:hypothetical protein E8E12_005248 [Didymella heteroderae]|uniref:RBR-type E3 ubiquitin transferase n=1 Tax=Didymella heteroderae TaxID=1769908 RepID=A0A9P5C077_9PLEO|nr:hypothetical protein E8E12_005248 [Didymella heteroderae]